MRIATWNVNSLNARLSRVEEWIDYAQPDVLCMQETKLADTAFPAMALSALGYESAPHGDGRWNGVAIASRVGLDDVERGFGPGPTSRAAAWWPPPVVGCGSTVSTSPTVGRSAESTTRPSWPGWSELRSYLDRSYKPTDPVAVCGDFNIAPDDRDIYDRAALEGSTHITEPERRALRAIEDWGLVDAFRLLYDQDGLFSWWDYRAGNFHKHLGMRIDLVLLTGRWPRRAPTPSSTATPARASSPRTTPRSWSTSRPEPKIDPWRDLPGPGQPVAGSTVPERGDPTGEVGPSGARRARRRPRPRWPRGQRRRADTTTTGLRPRAARAQEHHRCSSARVMAT
jgi:exodeoxyribonuclease-3